MYSVGGFDPRLPECKDYFQRLVNLSKELKFRILNCEDAVDAKQAVQDSGVGERCILFLKNVPLPLKLFLLEKSVCVLYTPPEEHFGIVSDANSVAADLCPTPQQGSDVLAVEFEHSWPFRSFSIRQTLRLENVYSAVLCE